MLKTILAHPLTAGLQVNDPSTTNLRRMIIEEKPFLKQIYQDWYGEILAHIPAQQGAVLELGSGAGFFEELVPGLITSEVFQCNDIKIVADAMTLPFESSSLKAIVMTDVLHHIPDSHKFFQEASRCLKPDGTIVMVEAWLSRWSSLIYKNLHHEPFDQHSATWTFPDQGPLSSANGALPWIIFQRDRAAFERDLPELRIEVVRPMMPFRYLVSGGVSMRSLMPAFLTPVWKAIEAGLTPWMDSLAMFAFIAIRKVPTEAC